MARFQAIATSILTNGLFLWFRVFSVIPLSPLGTRSRLMTYQFAFLGTHIPVISTSVCFLNNHWPQRPQPSPKTALILFLPLRAQITFQFCPLKQSWCPVLSTFAFWAFPKACIVNLTSRSISILSETLF